jgi:hypothetical protein
MAMASSMPVVRFRVSGHSTSTESLGALPRK